MAVNTAMKEKLEFTGTFALCKRHPTDRVTGSITVAVKLHLPERSYLDELLLSVATPVTAGSAGTSGSRSSSSDKRRSDYVCSPIDPLQWSPAQVDAKNVVESPHVVVVSSSDDDNAVDMVEKANTASASKSVTKSDGLAHRFTSPPPASSASVPVTAMSGVTAAECDSILCSPSGRSAVRPLTQTTSPAVNKRSALTTSNRMAKIDTVLESLSLIEHSMKLRTELQFGDSPSKPNIGSSGHSGSSSSCYNDIDAYSERVAAGNSTAIASNSTTKHEVSGQPLMSQSVRIVSKSSLPVPVSSRDITTATAVTSAALISVTALSPQRPVTASAAVGRTSVDRRSLSTGSNSNSITRVEGEHSTGVGVGIAAITNTNDTTDNLDVKSRLARLKTVTASLLSTDSDRDDCSQQDGGPATAVACYIARPRRILTRHRAVSTEAQSKHTAASSPPIISPVSE